MLPLVRVSTKGLTGFPAILRTRCAQFESFAHFICYSYCHFKHGHLVYIFTSSLGDGFACYQSMVLMSFVLEILCRHKWGGYECYFLSSKSFCETYTELAPFHLSFVFADNNRNDVSLSVFRREEYCFNEICVAYMHLFSRLHFVMSSRGMHYQFCNSSTCKCIYLRSFIGQFCI